MSNRTHSKIFASLLLSMGLAAVPFANSAMAKATSTKKVKTTTKKTTTTKSKTKKETTDDTTEETSTQPTEVTPTVFNPTLPAPNLTTITYPTLNAINWNGTDISAQNFTNIPMPNMQLSEFDLIPTVSIAQTTQGGSQLDVSILDDFITNVSPKARHYPPVFATKTERYNATQQVKQMAAWINQYAEQPNASYDVLLRAAKINAIGRNLDLGSDYAIHASNYIARAIKLNDTAEANFLYGAMLAEGGGFVEGSKYLEKAEQMGFKEATQSLAQADLLDDKKDRALQRLNDFKAKYPNDPLIDEQLRIINSGQYYIWNIPATVQR